MLQSQITSLLQSLKNWGWLSSQKFNIRHWFLISTLLLLGCSGCASLSGRLSQSLTPALEFRMNPVQSGDRPGLYTVSGQTTLPNKTQITVAAIRYLRNTAADRSAAGRSAADQPPNYTLLDRQFAQVSQGAWKADLNIWKMANGRQEAWQSPLRDLNIQSMPEVVFLATVDPIEQSAKLQNQLDRLDASRQLDLVRFTPDGEQYLQISQTLDIAPPKWNAPVVSSDRAPQEVLVLRSKPSSVSDWKPMPLPLSPDEFLR